MTETLEQRARLHSTLGEPHRLAIVDELIRSDRTPSQLGLELGLASNLVSHHLDVLETVGLIERVTSAADRRRRYVRLIPDPLDRLLTGRPTPDVGPVLFVCTQNSARSQLAAALWTERTGQPADSAGTDPAERVHPGAIAAASRHGLDLAEAIPATLADGLTKGATIVVTVCDRANEELCSPIGWWHWSTPDPAAVGTAEAFDATIAALDRRITSLR